MKISDIVEAQDWRSVRDPADQWLAKYTYENLDKWPGSEIIRTLQDRYPAPSGIIYRGINFYDKQKHDEFMSEFNGHTKALLTFGGVSSWTRHDAAAEQFAITQPTYFLNREVMVAHDRMRKERERLAGYRGIILGLHLADGIGIDVDASGVGHESEVILPPGRYRVFVHRVIKKYADHLADGDTSIDQVILSSTRDSIARSGDTPSALDHVLHHHLDKLSKAARRHLFKLYSPEPSLPVFGHSSRPAYAFSGDDQDQIDFHYWIPALGLFDLYQKGAFVDPSQLAATRKLAARIVRDALPVIRDNVIKARRVDLTPLSVVANIAGKSDELTKVIRDTIGAEYRRLEGEVRGINRIEDPTEKRRAIEKHTKQVTDLLSKIPGSKPR